MAHLLINRETITNDINMHDVMLFPSEFIMEIDNVIQLELYNYISSINIDENIIINHIDNIVYGIISIRDIIYIVFYNFIDNVVEFREYMMFSKHQILNKMVQSILTHRDVFPQRELAPSNINNRWINNIRNHMLTMNINLLEISINSFIIIDNNIVYLLYIQYNHKPNLIIL